MEESQRAPSTRRKALLGGGGGSDHKRITHQGHVKGLSDPLGGADPARVLQGARFHALSRTGPQLAGNSCGQCAYEFRDFDQSGGGRQGPVQC